MKPHHTPKAIQRFFFPDGGYVIHKVTDPSFAGRASAWYHKDGTLIDWECFDALNRSSKRESARPALERIGKRYAFAPV